MIVSSFTSPIDAIYLAAIFDPIFTASYPSTRLIHRISLFQALLRAFTPPQTTPPANTTLVDLHTLILRHPKRIVVVFPECTTTNGKAILPFSPSLLTTPPTAKIFPLSLRYTPADITTPIPHSYIPFLWNLLSKPTHCIRVRIAETMFNTSHGPPVTSRTTSSSTNGTFDGSQDDTASSSDTLLGSEEGDESLTSEEKRVLDKAAEALARLGRVQRVGLGVKEKADFVRAWDRKRR